MINPNWKHHKMFNSRINKQVVIFSHNGIYYKQSKGMNYHCLKHNGWISLTKCLVKEARHKSIYFTVFSMYMYVYVYTHTNTHTCIYKKFIYMKFKNRKNYRDRSENSDCAWMLEGLYFDLGGCYTGEYVWKSIKLYS